MSNSGNDRVMTTRLIVLGGIFGLTFIYYLTKLLFMQVVDLSVYQNRADTQTRRSQVIPAKRGMIFDRSMDSPLASSYDSFVLTLNPESMSPVDIEQVIKRLANLLGVSEKALKKKLPTGKLYQPVDLIAGIEYEKIRQIAEYYELYEGITWQSKPVRQYPEKSNLAHVLGYVGEITTNELQILYNRGYSNRSIIGKDGIEKRYDQILRGRDGLKFSQIDALGRGVGRTRDVVKPPELGKNVVLSIDRKIQDLTVKALGNRVGSALVMKPATGEILAMVSYPSYDPNLFYSNQAGDVFSSLSRNSYSPFWNRAIQSSAPPASTWKVVMSAAVVDTGLISPHKTILCTGSMQIGNRVFNCHQRSGHGHENMYKALADSCNIYYYTVGSEYLGVKRILDYAYRFGFGELTGIDLPGENEGLVPTPEWKQSNQHVAWVGGDTVNMSIGQGFLQTTPLQLASMVSMIVNDGVSYQPHLLKEIREPISNQVTEKIDPKVLRRSEFKPGTLKEIRTAMRGVITAGTGMVVNTNAVKIAGKSGTAETGRGDENIHSWFVAYAPYESANPEDVVVVVVWVDAVNKKEYWAPKATNMIMHGIFKNQTYEQVILDLRPWYLQAEVQELLNQGGPNP